jgi:hypothetical protein
LEFVSFDHCFEIFKKLSLFRPLVILGSPDHGPYAMNCFLFCCTCCVTANSHYHWMIVGEILMLWRMFPLGIYWCIEIVMVLFFRWVRLRNKKTLYIYIYRNVVNQASFIKSEERILSPVRKMDIKWHIKSKIMKKKNVIMNN